jgi:hypothetical protein
MFISAYDFFDILFVISVNVIVHQQNDRMPTRAASMRSINNLDPFVQQFCKCQHSVPLVVLAGYLRSEIN